MIEDRIDGIGIDVGLIFGAEVVLVGMIAVVQEVGGETETVSTLSTLLMMIVIATTAFAVTVNLIGVDAAVVTGVNSFVKKLRKMKRGTEGH